MPKRRRRRRRSTRNVRRRLGGRRGIRKRGRTRLYRSPVTKRMRISFRYNQILSFSGAAIQSHIFAANSVFQPDVTTDDHQPLGYDQYSPFYERYVVMGSRISCQFLSREASEGIIASVQLDTQSAASLNILTEIENRNVAYRCLAGYNSRSPAVLKRTFSARKFFSVRDPPGDPTLVALTSANPSNAAYYIVTCERMDGVSAMAEVQILVTLTYSALLFDPKDIAQS